VYYPGPQPWVTRSVGIKHMRERHCPCRGLRLNQVPTTPFPKMPVVLMCPSIRPSGLYCIRGARARHVNAVDGGLMVRGRDVRGKDVGKRRIWRHRRRILILLLIGFMWLNNTNLLYHGRAGTYRLLAHRGLAQTFDESEAGWDSNTAAMIDEPRHGYIENTIPSMRAAFDLGADAVEFDVKLSKDGQLAVFHDSTLAYRCGVEGEVQDYTMAELRQMDVGFGYTADGGKTYPLRGKGVGLMPTMGEALATFPDREFVIEVKDGKTETYRVLWEKLKGLSPERLARLSICCASEEGVAYLRTCSKDLKLLSKNTMLKALVEYELIGWTGCVPKDMRNTELRIPLRYARLLWGWPNRFMERMDAANVRVELVAGDGGLSEGFDTPGSLGDVPDGFDGYVWTNRIDEVGHHVVP